MKLVALNQLIATMILLTLAVVQNYILEIAGPALMQLELAKLSEEVEFGLTYLTFSF